MSARSKALIAVAALAVLALTWAPTLLTPAVAGGISTVTLTTSAERVTFGETVTLTASTVPAVVGEPVAIVDASGVELASGTTGQNGSFSAQVRPKTNLLAHASVQGIDSSPLSVGVRPVMTLRSGAIRLFDDVRVRGTFRPIRQGERVTIELQHRGTVVATKRAVMDAHGRFSATFRVPQAGSYRARAFLDVADLLPGRAATAPSVTPLPDLSSGARGIFVGLLERRLIELHYHLAGVDQVFDYRTADAVMAFRKVQRLPRTQDVNTEVWRALGQPKLFVPRNRADGVHVEVDQTRQVLAVVRDGTAQAIIHVSTGKPSTPTRDGTFQVFSKLAGFSPKHLYYPSFFDGERAIHGWTDVPTYAASHGCVRMPYWVTLWMFAQDPIGTQVIVYH